MHANLESFTYQELASLSDQTQQRLRKALLNQRAIIIKKHNISAQLFQEFAKVNQDFFNQNQLEKEKYQSDQFPLTGYKKFKAENLGEFMKLGHYPDLCEKYSWNAYTNSYPDIQFKYIYDTYLQAMSQIAQIVLKNIRRAFSKDLPCSDDEWNYLINGHNTLRHLQYPGVGEKQELGMVPHHDLGCLSIINQQCQNKIYSALELEINDEFTQIKTDDHDLVIMIGEVFNHISHGLLKACRHRVKNYNHPEARRTSTICFVNPHPNFDLTQFAGSDFDGLFTGNVRTYGELLKKDIQEYVNP